MDQPEFINPTMVAAELNLPIKRDWGGQTLSWDEIINAAVQKYWQRRAMRQIKAVS
jgi:hypothetical protein